MICGQCKREHRTSRVPVPCFFDEKGVFQFDRMNGLFCSNGHELVSERGKQYVAPTKFASAEWDCSKPLTGTEEYFLKSEGKW